jgi:hypothetical protein
MMDASRSGERPKDLPSSIASLISREWNQSRSQKGFGLTRETRKYSRGTDHGDAEEKTVLTMWISQSKRGRGCPEQLTCCRS